MEKRTQVRMPEKVHSWLTNRAMRNNRSLNGEMITIFQAAQSKEQEKKESEEQKETKDA